MGGIFGKLPFGIGKKLGITPKQSNDQRHDPIATATALPQTSEQEKLNKRLQASLLTKDWSSGLKLGGGGSFL